MKSLDEIIKDKPRIHTRQIKMATYPHEQESIIVHGTLKDERYVPVFDVTGEEKGPGVIHHLDVKLLIAPNPLRIVQAEAAMIHVPMDECKTTLNLMKQLEGLEIKPGFSSTLRKIMGGNRGCTHLCHLITVMGQEIVHGWLTWRRREPTPLPRDIESLSESGFLIDSCRMWRKDGPRMALLADRIKKQYQ